MRRTLSRHSVSFGDGRSLESLRDFALGIGGSIGLESKRKSRRAKLILNMQYRLFGTYILRLELQMQLLCRSWSLSPQILPHLTVCFLRPSDSPIFEACQTYNFGEVRWLLETGQASIYDVDGDIGGLLEVCSP